MTQPYNTPSSNTIITNNNQATLKQQNTPSTQLGFNASSQTQKQATMKKILLQSALLCFTLLAFSFNASAQNALSFDGTTGEEVIIPNDAAFEFSSGTIEAWVKPTVADSNNRVFIALRGNPLTNTRWSFHLNVDANTIGMYNATNFFTVSTTLSAGTWYHIAANIDGTNTEIFVNGVSVGFTGHGMSANTGENLAIGSPNDFANYSGEYFQGDIDEVRVWNTVRTPTQIAAFKDVELTGSETGLVAYYDFNETSGTVLPDLTSNANHGTLTNMDNTNWVASTALPPATPSIFNATAVTTTGFTANFTVPAGAIDIKIEVDDALDFISPILSETSAGTGVFFPVTGLSLAAGTQYYYRVRAEYAGSVFSDYVVANAFMLGAGQALDFNGTGDYITVGNILTPSYTKEAWVFISGMNGVANNIISGGLNTGQHALWISSANAYQLSAGHNNVDNYKQVIDSNVFPFGSWQHVAVTYDAVTDILTLYRNGIMVDQATLITGHVNGNLVQIGRFDTGNWLGGSLDEIRVWDYARTQVEIQSTLETTLVGNESGLLVYYRLDETSGTTITDASISGNNGTTVGFGGDEWMLSGAMNLPANPFTTTWQTTDTQITIPTFGSGYNYDVVWTNLTNSGLGDGVISAQTGNYTITGLTNGDTYQIEITGNFPRIYFNNAAEGQDVTKILSVEQWGDNSWESMGRAFGGCANLIINASDAPDLSSVTDMGFMFSAATSLNQDLSSWNVTNVTNMGYLFDGATSFNQDLSTWNVGNVTFMHSMFRNATAFNQDLNTWDVSKVIQIWSMFDAATSFNGNISNWDVSSVANSTTMFRDAVAFNQNLSTWSASSNATFNEMFKGATSFNGSVSSLVFSSATSINSMFEGATAFNQDISSWDLINVTSFTSTFNGATSFDQNLGAWNIASAVNMIGMFNNTAMSITNYDNTLIGWADDNAGTETIPTNSILTGAAFYSTTGEAARTSLIDAYNWTISGDAKVNYALSFDGTDDYITAPINSPTSYTIETWVNLSTITTNNAINDVILRFTQTGNPTTTASHQLHINASGQLEHYTFDGVGKTVIGSTVLNPNQWYHVAIAAESNGLMRLFVNGVEEGTAVAVSNIWAAGTEFRIGEAASQQVINGQVDEVRIWNYAKSAAQINFFKDQELNGTEPGLIAYYNFSDGPGSGVLTDINTVPTTYNATLNLMDNANAWVTNSPILSAPVVDITPPNFSVTPSASAITHNSFDLTVQLDEVGTAYYTVLPSGDPAPTAANIKSGVVPNQLGAGSIPVPTINTDATLTISGIGLSPATTYNVYVVG